MNYLVREAISLFDHDKILFPLNLISLILYN